MTYLSIQDFVWINHKVTRHVHPFEYSRLEDGVYCQYGYGTSKNLFEQAKKLLVGLNSQAPFKKGNRATAWIGFVAFLTCNGAKIKLSDDNALPWLDAFFAGPNAVYVAESCEVIPSELAHDLDVASAIEAASNQFAKTIEKLNAAEETEISLSRKEVEILNRR